MFKLAAKIVLIIFFCFPNSDVFGNDRMYLGMDGGYKTGDFGTPTRTNLFYAAPVLGYITNTYNINITVPYLLLSTRSDNDNGLGDIILYGNRVIIPESDNVFSLDGAIAIKLPTADKDKELGTGNTDFGGFIGIAKNFEILKLSLAGGYIKTGDSDSQNYNDIFTYGVMLSKKFVRTNISAAMEGRKYLTHGSNPQTLSLGAFRILNTRYSIKSNLSFGLNDDTPDFGLGIGIIRWF